jgi:hypothetical protein
MQIYNQVDNSYLYEKLKRIINYLMKLMFLIILLLYSYIDTTHIHQDTNFLQVNSKTETSAHKLMDYLLEYEGVISNNPLNNVFTP